MIKMMRRQILCGGAKLYTSMMGQYKRFVKTMASSLCPFLGFEAISFSNSFQPVTSLLSIRAFNMFPGLINGGVALVSGVSSSSTSALQNLSTILLANKML